MLEHLLSLKDFLAWDSFEVHLTNPVKNLLKETNTESVIVPGGCTKYIQAPDVVWNKPFKSRIAKFYDEWLANGVHQYTEAGNLKAVLRRLVVTWVVEMWKEISKEMITQPFKGCALTIGVNGNDDHEISCFKPGKFCADGLKLLEQKMTAFCDAQQEQNPFNITDSDIEDTNIEENIISEDEITLL